MFIKCYVVFALLVWVYLYDKKCLEILPIFHSYQEIFLEKNVCLSWISSDGSICCEGREYQWAGRALFANKNFIEGNPITQFPFKERSAVCLGLMASMKYKHCHEQKPLILKKFDILYISPKSNFFYEDIPV